MLNDRAKIALITLKLLNKNEWEKITIDLILKKSKLNKKKITNKFKNKIDLLKNIILYFDDLMNSRIKLLEKSTQRDMIFEILMLRFDLLNLHRLSIKKIFKIFKAKPNIFIKLLPTLIDSIEKMAKSSNIKTTGVLGRIKIKGLLVIYFSVLLTWIKDESSSLDKTMTVLDNYLNKAENILQVINN